MGFQCPSSNSSLPNSFAEATWHEFKLTPNIILTQSKSSVSPIVCVYLKVLISRKWKERESIWGLEKLSFMTMERTARNHFANSLRNCTSCLHTFSGNYSLATSSNCVSGHLELQGDVLTMLFFPANGFCFLHDQQMFIDWMVWTRWPRSFHPEQRGAGPGTWISIGLHSSLRFV